MHSSTFGGNSLASAVGIVALEVAGEQDLWKRYFSSQSSIIMNLRSDLWFNFYNIQ